MLIHELILDSSSFSSSSLALQPNVGLRLHNGSPPYLSIPRLLLPAPNYAFITSENTQSIHRFLGLPLTRVL